jgi:N-acetylmuramoyl-L-alanine amidase
MKPRRTTKRIIIHCSATRPEWMRGQGVASKREVIRGWHVNDRRWSDIGYHRIIDRDGEVADGRQIDLQGAHTRGQNADSVAVCLIGGHGASADDAPEDHFTAAQLRALVREVGDLREKYPGATVHGHNEFANKGCPGFRVGRHWSRLVKEYDSRPVRQAAAVPWWARLLNLLKGF